MRSSGKGRDHCDIAVLVDAETGTRRRDGRFVPDRHSVEAYVFDALRAKRGRVEMVPFGPDVGKTIARLTALKPGLVFNLTEWIDGDRALDAAIAGLLDMLKLRYTGTGPAGMRLARDKALSKQIVAGLGIAVPRHFAVNAGGRVRNPGLPYPLIVKPQFGDASEGIRLNSVVESDAELRARARMMSRRVSGPLICEEFIPGRDLYVALLGNKPQVMPPVELSIGKKGAGAPRFATYRLKNDGSYRSRWRIRWRRAQFDRGTLRAINEASRRIFHALKLRDYARIDYRFTPDGRLVFLEANPNPDLHPHAMGINLCFAGVDHADAVLRIVEAARRRFSRAASVSAR
jgi:D-alanine-D-alanine ligase